MRHCSAVLERRGTSTGDSFERLVARVAERAGGDDRAELLQLAGDRALARRTFERLATEHPSDLESSELTRTGVLDRQDKALLLRELRGELEQRVALSNVRIAASSGAAP